MNKRVVIFDLDGTLVDVVPLMLDIFNTLAPTFGYTPLQTSEISGVRKINLARFLFQKLGFRFWQYKTFHQKARALYRDRIKTIEWFPGMPELYQALMANDVLVGIISTNSAEAIKELLAHHALRAEFILSTSFFGKAKAIRQALRDHHIRHEEVVYIGDELRDIRACQKAGVDIIAVTWGLNDGTALKATGVQSADTVAELRAKLLS